MHSQCVMMHGEHLHDAFTMSHDAWGAFEHLVKWCEHLKMMQPVGYFTETDFVFLCTKTNEHKQEDRYKQCLSNMTDPLIDTWIILIDKIG